MCMIEDADGCVTLLSKDFRRTSRERTCDECRRPIAIGEMYLREKTIFEGEFSTWTVCPQCLIVRHWLQKECGGYLYGGLQEDLEEHLGEVDLRMWWGLARLVVGMRRQWQSRKMPRVPLTTRDLLQPVTS